MIHTGGNPDEDVWLRMGPHDEFVELCAVSTSGNLTEEEETKLKEHLSVCSECREALKEFQTTAEISLPLFAAEASRELRANSDGWSVEAAETALRERLARERNVVSTDSGPQDGPSAKETLGGRGGDPA